MLGLATAFRPSASKGILHTTYACVLCKISHSLVIELSVTLSCVRRLSSVRLLTVGWVSLVYKIHGGKVVDSIRARNNNRRYINKRAFIVLLAIIVARAINVIITRLSCDYRRCNINRASSERNYDNRQIIIFRIYALFDTHCKL